jgi:hypothetical protein
MERYGADVFGSDYGPLTCWLENFNEILDWKKVREFLQILSVYYIFYKEIS